MHAHGAEWMKRQAPSLFHRNSVLEWSLLGRRDLILGEHDQDISLAIVQANVF